MSFPVLTSIVVERLAGRPMDLVDEGRRHAVDARPGRSPERINGVFWARGWMTGMSAPPAKDTAPPGAMLPLDLADRP